jgi:Rieske Fe-S protein
MAFQKPSTQPIMKTKLHSLAFAILASTAVIAQDSTTTKTTTVNPDGSTTTQTTTTTGTIHEYVPGTTFVVKETSGPVTYRYGKTVSYVTKGGKIISADDVKTRIRVGLPVSVHYYMDGDTRVVQRVVIDD